MCRIMGHCSLHKGDCVARINTDCKESLVCKNGAKCVASRGLCVKTVK